jgi:putative spermidine/putrescine transport system substrate-binding protein
MEDKMATSMTRRDFLATTVAATAAAAAMTRPAWAASNFVVATYGGLYSEILDAEVIPAFESANGVTVQKELGWGSKFIPKIIASRANPPFDVVYVNEDEAFFGQTAGLWEALDTAATPNVNDLHDVCKPDVVPMYTGIVYEFTCAYNPEKMDKPKSWQDLWQKGITVGVPHISSTYGTIFVMIAAQLNGGGAEDMDKGFEALKALDNMKIYKGVTDGFGKFQQGEMDAALFYRHRIQLLIDQGVSLAFTTPAEGTYGMRTGVQIPKNVGNMKVSLDWANRIMGPDYQKAFAPKLYSPSNKTVVLDDALAAKHVYGEEKVSSLRFADWEVLNPKKAELLERWNKEFTG